jgi:DNA-binding NarL/FixJ family response regulator
MGNSSLTVWIDGRDVGLRDRLLEVLRRDESIQPCESPEDCSVAILRASVVIRSRGRPALGRAHIIAIVDDGTGAEVRRALASGADGVVFNADMDSALLPTVRAVAAGQIAVPRTMRQAVNKPALTAREKQILALVVIGFSNREIADRLVLAESTIKSHLFSAFRRLGVHTRKEAVAMILDEEQGLGSGILSITR